MKSSPFLTTLSFSVGLLTAFSSQASRADQVQASKIQFKPINFRSVADQNVSVNIGGQSRISYQGECRRESGRGNSSDPRAMRFGDMVLDDHVTVVLDALKQLNHTQVTLLGHSQGALVIEMAAERLKNQNLSLSKLGVKRSVLLEPSMPSNVPRAYTSVAPIDTHVTQSRELAKLLK